MAKPAEGMYKTKARNLSDAQLKRAKGLKASAKRTVSVSATKRITEGALKGKTVGAGGKPLTGTVVMANGDRAVYKAGKRVTNVPKKSIAPKGGNGGGGGGGGGDDKGKTLTGNKRTNRLAGARYEKMKGVTAAQYAARNKGSNYGKTTTPSNLTGFSGRKPGSVAGPDTRNWLEKRTSRSVPRTSAIPKASGKMAKLESKNTRTGKFYGEKVFIKGIQYRWNSRSWVKA